MSVVERALDKLRGSNAQAARAPGPAPTPHGDAIGALVEAPAGSGSLSGQCIAIDRAALRAAGYLPEESQDRRFADEYRQIKRPLIAKAFSSDAAAAGQPSPRLVMMASALPGDGKTFTSINLALSLAKERDFTVVLVDADVAKPHISRIFGVADQAGLLDALADASVDAGSLIQPTDVARLSILPAGKVRDGATELLSSGRMEKIANRILSRDPHCIALFDSSPLVVSSESRALVGAVGQVIVVVRAGHTPRKALMEALEVIGPQKQVSLVLNQGRRGLIDDGYYGYGYQGQGDENQK